MVSSEKQLGLLGQPLGAVAAIFIARPMTDIQFISFQKIKNAVYFFSFICINST
jgi:hypothetical protein